MLLGEKWRQLCPVQRQDKHVYHCDESGAVLEALRAQAQKDLLKQAWMRNGWPMEMMPELMVSPPVHVPADEMAATIRDMAAGLKGVDDTAILEDADLEVAARKLVSVIEQTDIALQSGGGGSA